MATIFLEGFDTYGPVGQLTPSVNALLTQGAWNLCNFGLTIGAPLSRTGFSLAYAPGSGNLLGKTLPSAYSRLIGGIRFQTTGTLTNIPNFAIAFWNDSTPCCTIQCDAVSGLLSLRTGGTNGTTIGTPIVAISENSIHYLEWDISFGATSNYHLYLDGVSIQSGTGNTGNGFTTADVFMLLSENLTYYDDLYIFDTTGSTNNAVLNTNPRIETRFPSSDAQTQWTNGASLLGSSNSASSGFAAPGANTLFLRPFTSAVAQTIDSVSTIPNATSGSVKFKAVIYSDSAGSPHTLLSSGVEVVGSSTATTLTSNLVTPQSLSSATQYWIGFITDTSIQLYVSENNFSLGQVVSNTYTSGAPSTAPSMTVDQTDWLLWGNCTGAATNWESMSQNPPSGDISSINADTVNKEDLYAVPALSATSANIYSVGVRGNFKRSDSGARTVDLRLKSSSTDSAGSNSGISAGQSYGTYDTYFDQDPNGPTGWTLTSANAIEIGPKIAS